MPIHDHLAHAHAPRRVRSSLRGVAASVVACAVIMAFGLAGGPASAHTEIDYTLPAADESVPEPVTVITVAFTDPVELVGGGFEVFTPQEVVVRPSVSTVDDLVFVLQLDQPLAGGAVGVRYEVAAADGHIVDGSFSFNVLAPLPTTPAPVTAPPATSPPATPPPTTPPTSASDAVATPPPTTVAPGTTSPSLVAAPPTTAGVEGRDGGGSNLGIVIGILVALALTAGAFAALRSRRVGRS